MKYFNFFFGYLQVTCNSFFHKLVSIQTYISKLSKSGDFSTGEIAADMMCKFDKYRGRIKDIYSLLFVAIIYILVTN